MRREGGDTDAVCRADPTAFSIALTEAEEFAQLLPLLRDGVCQNAQAARTEEGRTHGVLSATHGVGALDGSARHRLLVVMRWAVVNQTISASGYQAARESDGG
jgi:hypothetical protein